MKIALINSIFTPYTRGGTEVVFANIVQALQSKGHDVFVITANSHDGLEDHNGLKVYRVKPCNIFSFLQINNQPAWKRFFWHILDVFSFGSYFKIKKILKKESPVLVLSHNLKGLGYLTLSAVRKCKIKNIHTLHDIQLVNASGLMFCGQENNWLNQSFLAKVYAQFTRWLINSPEIVISPSKWLLNYYVSKKFFEHSNKVVLPNPVMQKDNAMVRQPHHDIAYLFLGQIERHKGIEFLLNVWQKFGRGKLFVAGSGSMLNELKVKYQGDPSVEFLGYIEYAKLPQVFSYVNYTIVPSLCYENSPTVITESFSFGVPVIVADIGGAAELVKDGFNGYTFTANDFNGLLNKLNLSLSQAENWQKLGENGLSTVKDLSTDKYLERLLSLN